MFFAESSESVCKCVFILYLSLQWEETEQSPNLLCIDIDGNAETE
jgi:hypothetical protein